MIAVTVNGIPLGTRFETFEAADAYVVKHIGEFDGSMESLDIVEELTLPEAISILREGP